MFYIKDNINIEKSARAKLVKTKSEINFLQEKTINWGPHHEKKKKFETGKIYADA